MAKKANILATINGFITAIITQAKVRSAYSTVVDEVYADEVFDDNSNETYTTKNGTSISYNLVIKKTGNITIIQIVLRNETAITISANINSQVKIFDWKNNEFKPSLLGSNSQIKLYTPSGSMINCTLNNTGLFLCSALPILTYYESSFEPYINNQI